ncbi:MAG: glycosyltransferase family 32 protein [Dysgonomonas sp.]
MKNIPKIIHQIWSDKYKPLPPFCSVLAETWKEKHPDWMYILWNDKMMDEFVQKEYSQYCDAYNNLTFDIQRWDAIRFFILKKMGGLYIDTDYECLENIEPLIENAGFAVALDPESHYYIVSYPYILNHALMASIPNHPFLDRVINEIFIKKPDETTALNKIRYVMSTTGPQMLSQLYDRLSSDEKSNILLLEAKYVTPFDLEQINMLKAGVENEELEACLDEAYAVHYYSNSWF